MRIAITGGTGFVGRHLARRLLSHDHDVVLLARGVDSGASDLRRNPRVRFAAADVASPDGWVEAFDGCDGVAHCAGINRELGAQTYRRVHVQGTLNVVRGARRAGCRRIALVSFLRARPACGSLYHESKWAAEQIVRQAGLEFTVLKPGVIYGKGDHMLDHLSHALHTFPIFPLVGIRERRVRPIAVDDIARVLEAALVQGRLSGRTVPVLGPEEMTWREAISRVAGVVGRHPLFLPAPVWTHRLAARLFEVTMRIPLTSSAQVRMLAEGLVEPVLAPDPLPPDLRPATAFTPDPIRSGLPPARRFGLRDCRWFLKSG